MKIKLCNVLYNLKIPIMSFGIIAFTKVDDTIKFLLINKRNTVGFCDLVKGNYDKTDIRLSLKNIISVLTKTEASIILNNDFDYIWKYMWNKNIDKNSQSIFETNKNIIYELLHEIQDFWIVPEWEFPKGRKNYQEKEIDCALREFHEETGIDEKHINIIYNVNPLEEMYIGTNLNYYKHKYFLAYIDNVNIDLNSFQKFEVRNLKLLNYKEAYNHIRDYHYAKRECLDISNYIINTFNFFSPSINVI
jgi:ADP-ribose pyrophosphatase YjhB (NUDIX family)